MDYRVYRVRGEDWEQVRELRLRMIEDTPLACLETYAEAQQADEAEWRFRAERSAKPGSVQVIAATEDGLRVGTMAAYTDDAGTRWLVGVWVDPAHRGSRAGVADLLLDAVLAWARGEGGAERLVLEVHERNERAIAFYRRRGFEPTGRTTPYPLAGGGIEHEMALTL
ncbi:GNAT family N-acetyltransferase [Kitasatospora sp. LaBMicrA B282]|uniref:GNAT family N-acetyltransferase n=1 Tax=Kitasatospora sp. LaBMicrA B282 TaxID=3420949 RepID=UPI003D0B1A49